MLDCEFLKRYLGRRVSIVGYQERILGTVAKVAFDHIVLTDTQMKDRLESGGWFEKIQEEDGESLHGPRSPETVVSGHHFFALTCLDEEISDVPWEQVHSAEPETDPVEEHNDQREPQPEEYLSTDPVELQIGAGLIPLADEQQGGDLSKRIPKIRTQLAEELGFVLPNVKIRDNLRLEWDGYEILIDGVPIATGSIQPQKLMVIDPAGDLHIVGDSVEPIFGVSACWVQPEEKENFEREGAVVVEPSAVVVTHLLEVIRRHAAEILTLEHVKELLDQLRQDSPVTVDELVPRHVSIPTLHLVLQQLLSELVSIRHLGVILQSLSHCPDEMNAEARLRHVRCRLAGVICDPLKDKECAMRALEIETEFAELIAGIPSTLSGRDIVHAKQSVASYLRKQWPDADANCPLIFVVDDALRLRVKNVLQSFLPYAHFLGFEEIREPKQLKILASLGLTDEASVLGDGNSSLFFGDSPSSSTNHRPRPR